MSLQKSESYHSESRGFFASISFNRRGSGGIHRGKGGFGLLVTNPELCEIATRNRYLRSPKI
ncbi:MAG: hypothetical protein AAGA10_27925 [Bacteroidota bacterium]